MGDRRFRTTVTWSLSEDIERSGGRAAMIVTVVAGAFCESGESSDHELAQHCDEPSAGRAETAHEDFNEYLR
jgi:hypothetical protein